MANETLKIGQHILMASFFGTDQSDVKISSVDFYTVIPTTVDLTAVTPASNAAGADAGHEYRPESVPTVPRDLPAGIKEVKS